MCRETEVLERKLPKVFLPCQGLENSLRLVRRLVEERGVCRRGLNLNLWK